MNSTLISLQLLKKIGKELVSSQSEFTHYLPQPNRDSFFLYSTTKEQFPTEIKTLLTRHLGLPASQ